MWKWHVISAAICDNVWSTKTCSKSLAVKKPSKTCLTLWPSDAIWRHRSGSTLAQVMACCLTAPSHYLNQCWLFINEVQWHTSDSNFTMDTSAISSKISIEIKFHSNLSGANESLLWRHNGHSSVSNHQPYDRLHNCLFRRRSKQTSKLRVTGLCVGNSPGIGEFPAQMASYAENVFIWWLHHVKQIYGCWLPGIVQYMDISCKVIAMFKSRKSVWSEYPWLKYKDTISSCLMPIFGHIWDLRYCGDE